MLIRKCTEADLPAVGAFYDRVTLHLATHTNYPKWTHKVYPSEDSARAMLAGQYVCLEGEAVAGAFVLNDDPQGAYEKGRWRRELARGEYAVCHALASDPGLPRRGIGRQLVRFCLAEARNCGYKALRLDVVPGNLPARALYEGAGFSYAGDADLERGIEGIPLFSLYEYNFA